MQISKHNILFLSEKNITLLGANSGIRSPFFFQL